MESISIGRGDGLFYRVINGYHFNSDALYSLWKINTYQTSLRIISMSHV